MTLSRAAVDGSEKLRRVLGACGRAPRRAQEGDQHGRADVVVGVPGPAQRPARLRLGFRRTPQPIPVIGKPLRPSALPEAWHLALGDTDWL